MSKLYDLMCQIKQMEADIISVACDIIRTAEMPKGMTISENGTFSTISFLGLSKTLILSPAYYRVDRQAETIIEKITGKSVVDAMTFLKNVKEKKFPAPGKPPFHPNILEKVDVAIAMLEHELEP